MATNVNYGAEKCDGLDNDCDGSVPGNESDADSDGFRICGGDCNDGSALANPGLVETTCDGLDNDCLPGTADIADTDGDGVGFC
ncbi:MAG: MopE-related protein, partial [Planctomycetota bacterium]